MGIEHDPDDMLVAQDRAALTGAGPPVGVADFDLDRAIALALAD
jgi:hypothetical protein